MADTRRVFVQQATLEGSPPALAIARPVMAFVAPEDSWSAVVNEFLMVRTPRSPSSYLSV